MEVEKKAFMILSDNKATQSCDQVDILNPLQFIPVMRTDFRAQEKLRSHRKVQRARLANPKGCPSLRSLSISALRLPLIL
jgi:hypothetical protein